MKILLPLLIPFFILYAQDSQTLPKIPDITIDTSTTPKEIPTPNENNDTKEIRNPFESVVTPKQSGQISNPPQLSLFTQTTLNLPSTARKIKKITRAYQNLDGSISTIEQELNGDIDWHFPLILSQEIKPEMQSQKLQDFNLGKIFDFHIDKQKITLKTPLNMIRDFTLASPTRLILDFKSNSKKVLQDFIQTNLPIISKVDLQTHLDFYRITFTLDGQYKYSIKNLKEKGLEIELF